MLSVMKNSIGGRKMKDLKVQKIQKIQFKEKLILQFSSFGYVYKIIPDNGNVIVLKGEEGAAVVASLIDKYEWQKIDIHIDLERDNFDWLPEGEKISEEYRYDFKTEITLIVVLKKERRVKSFSDRQKLPKRLLNVLPKEIKSKLQITNKQLMYIENLLEEVDFLIDEKELRLLTRQEASALIEMLKLTIANNTEPEPVPF